MQKYTNWKKLLTENSMINNDFFLLSHSGFSSSDAGPFCSDCVIVIFLRSGEMNITIDMKNYEMKSSSMITIMADKIFKVTHISEIIDVTWIMMSKQFAGNLFHKHSSYHNLGLEIAAKPMAVLPEKACVAFDKYIDAMKDAMVSDEMSHKTEIAKHLTLTLFYSIIPFFRDAEEVNTNDRKSVIFNHFKKVLSDNYRQERSVKFYADKLCVTPKYLYKIVTEKSGKTVVNYINEYVLNECEALLLSTEKTIQQIATEMNFTSAAAFSTFFRKMTGTSPSSYRD